MLIYKSAQTIIGLNIIIKPIILSENKIKNIIKVLFNPILIPFEAAPILFNTILILSEPAPHSGSIIIILFNKPIEILNKLNPLK